MTTIPVSYHFELSQPQRIISGLKTNFSLSPTLCTQVIKPQIPQNPQNWHKFIQNIHKHQTQKFWTIRLIHFAPVKKGNKATTCCYCGPFCWFINTRFCSITYIIGIYALCVGGWNSSVGRAQDSWPKGLSLNTGRSSGRIFFLRLDFLCWLSISVPPPCYHSGT